MPLYCETCSEERKQLSKQLKMTKQKEVKKYTGPGELVIVVIVQVRLVIEMLPG